MGQLTGNFHAFGEYRAVEELVSRSYGNVLKVVQRPSNGEKYLAVQNAWFQKFVMESACAVQDCYIGRLYLEGEVVL